MRTLQQGYEEQDTGRCHEYPASIWIADRVRKWEPTFLLKIVMVGNVSQDTVGCACQLYLCKSGNAEGRGITNEDVIDHRTGVYPHPRKIASGISRVDWLPFAF